MFLLSQTTHRMVIQHHPQIGHLYVPDVKVRIPNENGGYYVATNAQGFRSDVDFCPQKGGRRRILFLGDSHTAGDGCNNDERFSELVGELLDAEVYNFGLSGSGTDQQLLIFEQFAREIEADLIVLGICVENIERVKVGHRESIDRTTGARVLVPKPYFTLEDGSLRLNQVPVPRTRPSARDYSANEYQAKIPSRLRWLYAALDLYRRNPNLKGVRKVVRTHLPGLRSQVLMRSRFQPYLDYKSEDSKGWLLMRAILERFFSEASPTPVLVVPLPTAHFFLDGVKPIYQELYATLAAPEKGVHIVDLTSPLLQLSRKERGRLSFQYDSHFSPFGHQHIARLISEEILARNLLAEPTKSIRSKSSPSAKVNPIRSSQAEAVSTSQKPKYILGLSCFYHDSAACLIKDGEIVAAVEEERLTRLKNDRRFPHQAVNYCLEKGGIQQTDLAAVVYYDNSALTFERIFHTMLAVAPEGEAAWLRVMPSWLRYKLHIPQLIRRYLRYDGLVLQEVHHRSHGASAFYASPFERAAILTVDGVGEWATASIAVGQGNEIRMVEEMRFPHSLGLLYSAFTQFTGFKVNSGEYKMMGLAPYGEPKYVDAIYEHLVDLKDDGSIELNMEYFAFLSEPTTTNERFAQLFGGPARKPESRITKREMDLARSIQVVTEETILRMARHAHKLTGEKKLCMAGGVALNCVANGRLLREGPFEEIWIQPAAGDAGGALGAALDAYHTYFGKPRVLHREGRSLQGGSYVGPDFSANEIRAFLDTHGYPYRVLSSSNRADTVAQFLKSGKVVGHFSGGAEFGPRALGARSILGDARNQDMQANLNLKIKYRESFRPFAPTVLAEKVTEYFELDRESPYMLLVGPVKESRRKSFQRENGNGDLLPLVRKEKSDIPAVTHVDYSARVQTITHDDHPAYYGLIKRFEELTGCAVIVNTSFNVRGEPIVCTPYDAYRCFMRTEMDALVLEDFLLLKEDQPTWPENKGHVEEHPEELRQDDHCSLTEALRKLYIKEFLPLARILKDQNAIQVTTKFQQVPTKWVAYSSEQTPRAIFSIPSSMDSEMPDPEKMASAIVQFWTPGLATDKLRPVLARLLEIGIRERVLEKEAPASEEQVSEFVYVLY